MLPLEKALVESLFQDNLLRVVFATETLAAGALPSDRPSPPLTTPHHPSPSLTHGVRHHHARAL